MLHFVSFGSGSSGNCSLLFTETENILIDSGVGVRSLKKHFKNYGMNLQNVQNILITHDHADHVRSVGNLSKDYNIPVYTTEKVLSGISRNWSVRTKVPAENVRIIDNVGYCIEHGDVTFVLMTDIGHLTDEMKEYIGLANYLVIEADYEKEMLDNGPYPQHLKNRILSPLGHQSNAECGEAIAQYATPRLKHAWLCHLSDENNHPDLAEMTVKQVLHRHGIIAGNERSANFKLDVLKRKTPSEIFDLSF